MYNVNDFTGGEKLINPQCLHVHIFLEIDTTILKFQRDVTYIHQKLNLQM